MGALALGFGVGLGVAAWRVAPQLEDPLPTGFVILVLLAMFAAYRGGKRQGMGRYGQAHAEAHAESTSVAGAQSIVNLHLGPGAREVGARDVTAQLADAEWYGERQAEIDMDGSDMDDLYQDLEGEQEAGARASAARPPAATEQQGHAAPTRHQPL